MQNKNEDRNKAVFWGAILMLIFGISFYRGMSEYYGLKKYGRYTIGMTTKKVTTPKGGIDFDYCYTVTGKEYDGFDAYNKNIKVPGGRYYVVFSSENPDQSEMITNRPVPDSILEAPSEGWAEIPR